MKLETKNETLKDELMEFVAKLKEENRALSESVSKLHEESKGLRSDLSIQHKNYGVFPFFSKLPPKIRLWVRYNSRCPDHSLDSAIELC